MVNETMVLLSGFFCSDHKLHVIFSSHHVQTRISTFFTIEGGWFKGEVQLEEKHYN